MGIKRLSNGKFGAAVKVDGRTKHIGTFDSEADARAAVKLEIDRVREGVSLLASPTPPMSLRDYAERIGVPSGTVKRWAADDGLPCVLVGNVPRVHVEAADAWVVAHHPNSVSFSRQSSIYFAQRDRDGAIKIGWSSDVIRRMHEAKRDEKCAIVLLAVVPGDKPVEIELHARFAAHRLDGEWFTPAAEILAFIDSLSPGRSAA